VSEDLSHIIVEGRNGDVVGNTALAGLYNSTKHLLPTGDRLLCKSESGSDQWSAGKPFAASIYLEPIWGGYRERSGH
jgi:hypothetical protein